MAGLEKSIKTNFKTGIPKDETDHEARAAHFGDNQPIVKPPKTILELILENFEDDMLRILCGAAIISLVLGIATEGLAHGWIEGTSIIVAVVIIVTVTAGNNYMKEKQFRKLNAIAQQKNINVVRGGELLNISVYDLLVGDVVEIETGEILSVDGMLIQGNNISADESSITGESHEVKKTVPQKFSAEDKSNPFLVSGSKIMEGTGTMVILAIGKRSQYGRLKMKIQQDSGETPLQQKLSILAEKVGKVGLFSAILTFCALVLHYLIDCYRSGQFMATLFSFGSLTEVIHYFIISVTIIVVAIPEGLPLAVTIALAYSVGKMKDENNLVRYLQACETMGGVNNICTDKTGTLTKNKMTVVKMFIEEKSTADISPAAVSEQTRKILCLGAIENSNANPKIERQEGRILSVEIGNKTECALLEMAYKLGYDYKAYRNKENMLKIFPFSSARKKMTTIYKDGNNIYLFTKGAPDFLLEKCTHYLDHNGSPAKLTPEYVKQLQDTSAQFSSETLRTILLCYRELKEQPTSDDPLFYEHDFIIVALVGIKDPIREEITHSVELCHHGGVTVRMCTGDNKDTAIAIAKEAGILDKNWRPAIPGQEYMVMEGKEFREFVEGLINEGTETEAIKNLEKFKLVEKQLRVLARSSPEDKYLLATGLKELGNVVAMTGDGTNDAPALKKADIGFAMGIAGTEVAKEASGIILLDDNFKSIVTAMKWGRNIFDCIRKFLQFQLTINLVALVMAFIGALVLRESPLNAVQMLWINLIMDTLASLALATEPPSDELLDRKPYSRFESLITPNMWRNIISQGLLQICILCTILFYGPTLLNVPSSIGVTVWDKHTGRHFAIFFNCFVLLQLFNEINARKLFAAELNVFKHFFNNPMFIIILVFTFVVQFMLIAFGGEAIRTVPLTLEENLFCLVVGSMSLYGAFLFKVLLPRMEISSKGVEIGTFSYYWKPKDELPLDERDRSRSRIREV